MTLGILPVKSFSVSPLHVKANRAQVQFMACNHSLL